MSERPQSEIDATTAELAAAAGAVPPLGTDAVDQLRDHIKTFIDRMPGDPKGHAISQARSRMDEMVFWLRSHANRRQ